jgi:hypothetical protein
MTKIEIPKNLLLSKIFLIVGVLGLVLSGIGYAVNHAQFYHSWLVAFAFWASVGIGGYFLTLIHHLTGAVWSVVIRRLPETFMAILPFMLILFIPIIFGMHDLYHWTHQDAVAHDHLLQEKAPYLNTPFFIIRTVLFFAIWTLFGRLLYKYSIQNDVNGDAGLLAKSKKISPIAVILFAFTVSFASFDWLMSLDPHWYSTIFGVYYFAGSIMATYAFVTLFVLFFEKIGPLQGLISKEHYHDLGKLTFTFTIFWAYMAFSQYFLIWYANIPEETIWFLHRWEGSWKGVSVLLAVGHFVVPFIIMLIRALKRSALALIIFAGWMLLMHWVDMYWLVLPNLHHHGAHFSWIDVAAMLGIGGLFLWLFMWQLGKHSLVPINDPNLDQSINHRS